jgi:hypothetical protein
MSSLRLVAGSTLLLAGTTACAHLARPEQVYLDRVRAPGALPARLDATMQRFAARGFSGTVLVARGSRVLLYQGYGDANRARHIPNTTETRFPLGAIAERVERFQPEALRRAVVADERHDDSLVARGYRGLAGETVLVRGMVAPLADLYYWHQAMRTAGVVPGAGEGALVASHDRRNPVGWVVEWTTAGQRLVQQAADGPGYQTWYGYLPDTDILILVAANDDLGWRAPVVERLTELLTEGATPTTASVSAAAAASGG